MDMEKTYKLCRALWEKHREARHLVVELGDVGIDLLTSGLAEKVLYGYSDIFDDVVCDGLDLDLVADEDSLREGFLYCVDFDAFWNEWGETLCRQ